MVKTELTLERLKIIAYFKKSLFEGQANRLVPKNHWGIETELEMAAIAHSLLLGGPGFPTPHPAVYAHLSLRIVEPEDISDHPCAEDIPLNLANKDTKDLIDKVSCSS